MRLCEKLAAYGPENEGVESRLSTLNEHTCDFHLGTMRGDIFQSSALNRSVCTRGHRSAARTQGLKAAHGHSADRVSVATGCSSDCSALRPQQPPQFLCLSPYLCTQEFTEKRTDIIKSVPPDNRGLSPAKC